MVCGRDVSPGLKKAFRKGHRHHTIVCGLEHSTVEFVAEERRTDSLVAYYQALTDEQAQRTVGGGDGHVEPHITATRAGLRTGGEKIVFDRFHIMREMTKVVDTVRKQEHRGSCALATTRR
jgi:hypothetical protein